MGDENKTTTPPQGATTSPEGNPAPEEATLVGEDDGENPMAGADTGGGSMPWGNKPSG